ncbi:MAG: hypothetical protein LBQ57_13630 [Spirochaetales bacterium]|jgi:hypothetical protein|nr:hypothetical protein [Spirochaetales bacterium]
MKNCVDSRIPREVGAGALPDHPAIKTPWEKLISFYDAYHYATRHNAAVAACFMEVMRIIIPDYATRCKRLCEATGRAMKGAFSTAFGKMHKENNGIHPFMQGGYFTALYGDSGDERIGLCGRVNDFGTYRAEKELDVCDWDILGSEVCRISTYGGLTSISQAYGGIPMEYHMPEAKGCGDLHCRVVAENRDKYPMPEHECWENFGPIATADQIKFTPEEKMFKECQQFREECGYKYRNGLDQEYTAAELYTSGGATNITGTDYCGLLLKEMVGANEIGMEELSNIITCVFEAAGKTMFAEFFAVKGLRDWLGVPADVKDGRVLGGYIEVILQTILANYTIVEFNKEEVVYDIPVSGIERRIALRPMLTTAYLAMWYGMSKTLVGSQWSLWRETEGVPEDIIRLKIAKKIDKFCR